jgi:type I restriction enzyme, S subunit
MSEWRECKLNEIIKTNETSITTDYPFDEILYLDTGSITKGKIDGFQKLPISQSPSRAKRLIKKNDIIYSTVRPIQRHYGFIANPPENLVVSTGFAVITCNEKSLNPKFLYYYLTSDSIVEELDIIAEASTSTYPSLKPSDIEKLQMYFPIKIEEQKAIAAVLSSLDDKIDLLHRQNQSLEAMAETLFRQWFIEEAQEDWVEKSLLELVELIGGGTPKTSMSEYWNGDIPWLSGGDIANNHKGFVSTSEKTITKAGLDNSSAKLLPKFATVISARGTVGKYCLLASDMAFSQSNYGILPKIKGCYYFTYLLVNHVVEELQSAAYGSVFDTITTSTFRDATFATPPKDKIPDFESDIAKYFDKKLLNQTQIRTLEKLRDGLLPKLMSGEVRVKLSI